MATESNVKTFLQHPYRNFISLWIPVLFSILAEPLTGLVDTAFVSRLGVEALAALGVGTVILTSGLWLFNFLSVGSQTEVSQACGRGDLEKGKSIGSLAVFLACGIGFALTVLTTLYASKLAMLMGATGVVHDHAVTYITIRAFGGPPVLVTMTSFGILYGLADMRTPLLIAVAINGVNIVLDGLLIFGIGPFPEMGIAGAALASTISQWGGALWSCYCVQRKIGFTFKVNVSEFEKFLIIGRDMVIRTGSLTLFLLLATREATQLGPESGAAHQAIRQVWVFTNLFLDASAVAGQSIVGYYFGSGQVSKARAVAGYICRWTVLIGILLMFGMLGITRPVAVVLVPLSSYALFYPAWIVSAIIQPLAAIAFATDGIHWGTGDFRYLRNSVVLATLCGVTGLLILKPTGFYHLTVIWWITGLWISIRSFLGIIRIWPGMRKSPLKQAISIE